MSKIPFRILRGCCYYGIPEHLLPPYRNLDAPSCRERAISFRIVRNLKEKE